MMAWLAQRRFGTSSGLPCHNQVLLSTFYVLRRYHTEYHMER